MNKFIFILSISFFLMTSHLVAQTVLLDESFDDCSMPAGWTTNIIGGVDDWQFGNVSNGNAWASDNMNGSCMAYFDDDILGEDAPSSVVQLITPEFNGLLYEEILLSTQIHFRSYGYSSLNVRVKSGDELVTIDAFSSEDLTGSQFNNYDSLIYDISAYRAPNMQIIFEYDDDNSWAWWASVDEVLVTGEGSMTDLCANASSLIVGNACTAGSSIYAWYDGPIPSCSAEPKASQWYTFIAPSSGEVIIKSNAVFNDVLTVYEGSCSAFSELVCSDKDMFGFKGESLQLNGLNSGETYYICLSGKNAEFGLERGEHCIKVIEGNVNVNIPSNDLCENATEIVSGPCITGTNKYASFTGPEPSRNFKSRASIWYYLTAPASGDISIRSEADFSDVITLYEGSCGSLTELSCNEEGQSLDMTGLIPNETYFVQVTGYFSTIEGNVCMSTAPLSASPDNDLCINATDLIIGESCLSGSNVMADSDGILSSCDSNPSSSIWYAFTSPASGSVLVNSGSGFSHNVTVMEGLCNDLEEHSCFNDLSLCDGPVLVQGLNPFEEYYLQISSASNYVATEGDVCVSISDGANSPADNSLELDINVVCNGDGTGTLNYNAINGAGSYQYYGNNDGVILSDGTWYSITVEDANGCSVTESASISCDNPNESCLASDLLLDIMVDCNPAGNGDGSALVYFSASGGDGNYNWLSDVNNGEVLAAGESYSITLIDGEGCSRTGTGIIQDAVSSVVASIDNLPVSFGSDQPLSLSGTPSGGVWSGSGMVGSTFNPVMAGIGTHSISYTVADENGCPSIATQNIFIFSVTYNFVEYSSSYISPREFDELVQVYPNPTVGEVSITLPTIESDSDFMIHIFNAQGQIIHFNTVNPLSKSYNNLSLSDQVNGIYFIRVQMDDLVSLKRIVKQ